MQISQMTREQKLASAAQLDGIDEFEAGVCECAFFRHSKGQIARGDCPNSHTAYKAYDEDWNALMPLVQKQPIEVKRAINSLLCSLPAKEPARFIDIQCGQLLNLLLIAAGKADAD